MISARVAVILVLGVLSGGSHAEPPAREVDEPGLQTFLLIGHAGLADLYLLPDSIPVWPTIKETLGFKERNPGPVEPNRFHPQAHPDMVLGEVYADPINATGFSVVLVARFEDAGQATAWFESTEPCTRIHTSKWVFGQGDIMLSVETASKDQERLEQMDAGLRATGQRTGLLPLCSPPEF